VKLLPLLVPYFLPYRRQLVLGLAAIFASVAIGLAAPLLIGAAVDRFQEQPSSATLLFFGVLLVLVALVRGVFTFLQRRILVTLSRDIELDLRDEYFAHLERLPQRFYQEHATGDLMARATNDLQAVRMVCGPAIMYGSNTVFTALGCLVFMVAIHPGLSLLALAPMPLVAVATQVFGNRIHRHFEGVQEQFSKVSARVHENLAGLRVVRAFARERREEQLFSADNDEYVGRNRKLILWSAAFHPALQLLVGLGFVAVLWYGGRLVLTGGISIGQLVTFNFFLTKLIWPMVAIGWVINLVQRGMASLGRIRRVVDSEPEIRSPAAPLVIPRIRGRVEARGLEISYTPGGPPALRGISFVAEAGETIALVGRTGAGKSTLLAAVPRLIDPPPGTLLVDGVDVRRLTLEQLRGAIAVVPQESFLFSMTVGENIALGQASATPEAVTEAAEVAGLTSDLQGFPRGLDTLVGERGITLSGGQKQRVALARAVLRRPRILLLDDCLSAVDTQTEERILANLRRLLSGRTVLLVSHRISTVREADRILVLEQGEIVQRGTHEELVQRVGLYAELHQRQVLEEELAAI
jgi:ATP-binding cassette, subfamily B, multidrug efflux pump